MVWAKRSTSKWTFRRRRSREMAEWVMRRRRNTCQNTVIFQSIEYNRIFSIRVWLRLVKLRPAAEYRLETTQMCVLLVTRCGGRATRQAYLNIERFVAAVMGGASKTVADCARRTLRFRFFRIDDLNAIIPMNTWKFSISTGLLYGHTGWKTLRKSRNAPISNGL